MTDYEEEQRNEIEALESIYAQEMTLLSTEPYAFTVDAQSENVGDEDIGPMFVRLKFSYVPKYPDEPPIIEVDSSKNLDEEEEEQLLDLLQAQAQENLGMVMVFTLVSSAVEWLNDRADQAAKQKKDDAERKRREEEEAERKQFEGTRVTVESFLAWKVAFEAEMASLKKEQMARDDAISKKLTGRELFEKDRSMIESDLKFLADGEEEVKVDESLFQELEDLELEDEEETNENGGT